MKFFAELKKNTIFCWIASIHFHFHVEGQAVRIDEIEL